MCRNMWGCREFLSTPSARRATHHKILPDLPPIISIHALREEGDPDGSAPCPRTGYFYPRPPRGGRPVCVLNHFENRLISIHALREEGDVGVVGVHRSVGISIHALREEGDSSGSPCLPVPIDFYPRPPRGGRRLSRSKRSGSVSYFYPRPPRGGRLANGAKVIAVPVFLSTPSARRATCL